MHSEVTRITRDIAARSRTLRDQYRRDMDLMAAEPVHRSQLSCGNLAHGVASCGSDDKSVIKMMDSANIGIVTAYNDMLSAHAPYAGYPEKIKSALKAVTMPMLALSIILITDLSSRPHEATPWARFPQLN